jgi:hypothetical protein
VSNKVGFLKIIKDLIKPMRWRQENDGINAVRIINTCRRSKAGKTLVRSPWLMMKKSPTLQDWR